MNWSWPNSPQASPGFVYFNNSNTGDQNFIPFSKSPQQETFSPQNCSSPYKNRRGFNQQRNWNQNRFSGGRGRNRSYNSPQSSYSAGDSKSQNQFDNSYLIKAKFLHSSFLENPWEKLEKELEEKRSRQSESDSSGSSSGMSPNSGQKRSIDLVD